MTILTLLLLAPGCGANKAVYKAYEDARAEAFADPGPAPPGWKPDVRVHVSRALLDRSIAQVLEDRGTITGTVSKAGAQLTPELTIASLELGASNRCEECFAVDLDFTGTVQWSAGVLGQGTVPMEGSLAFDVAMQTVRDGDEWVISALPRDARSAEVRVPGWSGAVRNLAQEPLRKWLDEEVVSKIQPIPVTTYGGEGLPVRGLSLRASKRGLVVDLLTTIPGGGDVSAASADPGTGFVVHIAPETLVGVARQTLFEAGPQTYGIVPDARSLAVDRNRFTLGLRLWKVQGAGWWRDYTAEGTLGVEDGAIALAATGVSEGEKSRGAELADPLFWIGEGFVANAMQEAIQATAPTVKRQRAGGMRTVTTITRVDGDRGALRITGDTELASGMAPRDGKVKTKTKMKLGR